MKKIALAAVAAVALPLSAMPTLVSHHAPSVPAPNPRAGAKLDALISTDPDVVARTQDDASAPPPVIAAGLTIIQPVRIAIRPHEIAKPKPKPVPKRRVAAKASRTKAEPRATGAGTTIASWYNDRPSACWDRRGRHAFPRGLRIWTAHKTLPCGSAVVVAGPAGSMTVRVYDRGPYVAGRGLDLSAAAFRRVCGSTSKGVCRVSWHAA